MKDSLYPSSMDLLSHANAVCHGSNKKNGKKKNNKNLLHQYYKEYKREITMFLTEIYDLYIGLMKSSLDIDRIFQIPLRLIKAKQNCHIRSENIHKEEFTNMIKNDEFIRVNHFFNL